MQSSFLNWMEYAAKKRFTQGDQFWPRSRRQHPADAQVGSRAILSEWVMTEVARRAVGADGAHARGVTAPQDARRAD